MRRMPPRPPNRRGGFRATCCRGTGSKTPPTHWPPLRRHIHSAPDGVPMNEGAAPQLGRGPLPHLTHTHRLAPVPPHRTRHVGAIASPCSNRARRPKCPHGSTTLREWQGIACGRAASSRGGASRRRRGMSPIGRARGSSRRGTPPVGPAHREATRVCSVRSSTKESKASQGEGFPLGVWRDLEV